MAVRSKVEISLLSELQRGVLLDVALLLNDGEPIDALFERVADLLEGALEFNYVGISSFTEGSRVRLIGARPPLSGSVGSEFDLGDATLARLTSNPGVSVFTPSGAHPTAAALAAAGIAHGVTAALRAPSQLLGTFTCGRNRDEPYSEADLEFVRLLGIMLSQSMAAERARAEAARSRLLNEVALLVNAGEPAVRFFDRLRQLLAAAIPMDSLLLLVAEPDGLNLRVIGSLRSRTFVGGDVIPVAAVLEQALTGDGNVVTEHLVSSLNSPVAHAAAASGVQRLAVAVLRDGPRLLGILSLGRQENRAFTASECELLNLLATFLGQSLANEKRIAATETEAARASLLNQLGLLLNAGEDVESLFDRLPPLLRRAVDFDYVGIAVEAGRPGYLKALDWNSRMPVSAEPTWVTRNFVQMDTLTTSSEPAFQLRMEPDTQVPGTVAAAFARAGVRRSAFFLLGPAESPLGILHLARARPDRFSAQEMVFLEVVAAFFSQAVGNQLRVLEALGEAQEQRILAEVAAVAARETDPMTLLNGLVGPLRVLVPRPWLAYGYLDGDRMVWPTPAGELVLRLNDDVQQALDLGQQVGVLSLLEPHHPTREAGITLGSYTASFAGGVAIGLLYIATREPGHTFAARELRLFKLIAQIVGPAMSNARSAKLAQIEAEEQRVIAEAASAAARGSTIAEIIGGLASALSGFVPGAFAMYGRLSEDTIIYDTVTADIAPFVLSAELQLPLSAVGLAARANGHGQGSMAWSHGDEVPEMWAGSRDPRLEALRRVGRGLGLQKYALVPYHAAAAPVGMLMVASTDPGYAFLPAHIALLGRVARIVGPAIEAVRAAANIARQSELNELVLRSLTEGVILLDHDGNVVFANSVGTAAWASVTSVGGIASLEDFIRLVPKGARANIARAIRDHVATKGRTRMVVDGDMRWMDYGLIPVDDALCKLLIVTTDVTAVVHRQAVQRKQRDQLEQASRLVSLGELVGGVAHELNNPLTAVLGFSEILSLAPEAASLSEEIGIIQKEALRARDIVRELLTIARPAPVEQAEVAMSDVIGHIERLRRHAWAHAGIEVEVDIDLAGSPVWGNESQLAQVFLNLLTNAEHAIGDRGGSIRIIGRRNGEEVRVCVSDTGSGMPQEVVERVFEPFFSTKQSAGNGLGLSLSRTMVLSHRGTISVESELGVGTTFTVTLPVHATTLASVPLEPQTSADEELHLSAASHAVRILVIDDEPNLRKLCQRLIISMGHRCSVAQDSATALALVSAHDFDLVLCDYRLAHESAAAVIAGFSKHAPHLVERTVIATGATNDPAVLDLVARFGLRLIAKPYGGDEIAGVIADAALLRG